MKSNSGDLAWHFIWLNSLAAIGILIFSGNQALAQVTPDNTLGNESSVVNPRDASSDSIEGGATRGQNLFHSFIEFNVDADRGVYFANPEAVTNIFSRVTGNDVSDILGTLGVDGAANLYLINPNGIIFGEGARLDVEGSFAATTAESLILKDGSEFSAVNPQNSLLTISVPLGLQFGNQPGNIINRSFVTNDTGEFVGLEVAPGNNLAFIGGNINFEAGEATASGGNITLGGLSEAGIVSINEDGSFSFPEDITKADITLSNAADIDASGTGGGNIAVNARNLSLTAGEFGGSFIRSGISPDSTSVDAQAGNITIDVAENITIDDGGGVGNQVDAGGIGDAGNININTNSLSLSDGSQITAGVFGQGNAGTVSINASDNLTFQGIGSNGFPSGIINNVESSGVGNAGNIEITAANLNLISGGRVTSNAEGQGNAGLVDITATGDLTFDGDYSGVFSQVSPTGIGNAAGVTISTSNLTLINSGSVDASTFGQGNAGLVDITATGDLTFDGEDSAGFPSGVFSGVAETAEGNSGGITISTANLNLTNGGLVSASTFGQGNAGAVNITATGDLIFDGEDSAGFPSGITSLVNPDAVGNAAGVTISTSNLTLTNGGRVNADTFGQGNAGLVNITATGDITADGEDSDGSPSSVTSQANSVAVGDAGGVTISTTNLNLTNGGRVDASTFGQGNAGAVNITATGDLIFDGETLAGFPSSITSGVGTIAVGNAGGVSISTNNLTLTNGGQIGADTFGQGNAGAVNITATRDITADGDSDGSPSSVTSQANSVAVGDAGGVTISTTNLNLTNGGIVSTSTLGQGNAGAVNITATGDITADGEDSAGFPSSIASGVNPDAVGNAGGVSISTNNLTLTNGGRIGADIFGQGNAGTVNITATGNITADGENSSGFPSGITSAVGTVAVGNAGGVTISTTNLTLTNGGRVNASTLGQGNAGNIKVNAESITLDKNSSIAAFNTPSADISTISSGGNIDLQISDNIVLRNSDITTQASINANGGNITITADSVIAFDDSDIFAFAADGQGGNITLNTPAYFAENFTINSLTSNPDSLDNNSRADLNATGAVSGVVTIPDVSFIQNSLNDLPNNSINTDELVANSCVSPVGNRQQGKFVITGTGGLPARPGDGSMSDFATGEVRNVPSNKPGWQRGEPIVEPQGVYRLANGKLVMSRECSQ